MTEERTITSVPWVWNATRLEYVAGEPVVTTEQRVRAMTAEESAVCALGEEESTSVTTSTPTTPTTTKPAAGGAATSTVTKASGSGTARNPKTGDASAALGLTVATASGILAVESLRRKRS